MKTRHRTFVILPVLIFLISLPLFSENQEIVRIYSQKIKELDIQIEVQKREMLRVQFQIDMLKQLKVREEKINRVVLYYKQAGTFDTWHLDREQIEEWFEYADKWQDLAGTSSKIDLVDFIVSAIHNESNGDRKAKHTEENGTISYGATQLNEKCIPEIERYLDVNYPELRHRDIRTDLEKNIAGRFVWISHRIKNKQNWALMDVKTGWRLYYLLEQIR